MLKTVVLLFTFLCSCAPIDSIICPDGISMCQDGQTCCILLSGKYGCCPLPSAVCCKDRLHCCPSGYSCNLQRLTCDNGGNQIPMLTHKAGRPALQTLIAANSNTLGNVFCPDHKSQCPDGFTCCTGQRGDWECCPLPNATCCADHQHCCPHGTTCHLSTKSCIQKVGKEISIPWKAKVRASTVATNSVICPDQKSYCPTGYTCCLLSSGMYGCCPYQNAVCCSDHLHCCPSGMICDIYHTTCKPRVTSPLLAIPFHELSLSKVRKAMVKCPDGSSCPGQETCCELSSGGYGCCPYEEAVCCSDGKHCCPHGTTCDVAAGTCKRQRDAKELPMSLSKVRKAMVKCPDGSSCPGQETCCELSSGGYGCCSYEKAVCCSDGKHCCPHGTTCDVAAGTCKRQRDAKELPMSLSKVRKAMVKCPDGSSCPGQETCCKLSSGGYGCCSYEKAVCCSDGKHCCPHGTTCDVAAGTCKSGINVLSRKLAQNARFGDIICPDGISACPSGDTCCKVSSGDYGCCPLPHAVCCTDGKHCCPKGTICDLSSETCISERDQFPMRRKVASFRLSQKGSSSFHGSLMKSGHNTVVCPSGKAKCKDGSTCCLIDATTYGCCPHKNAVCCSDRQHCCPNGYTCGPYGFCERRPFSIRAPSHVSVKKMTSIEGAERLQVDDIVCPDQKTTCFKGTSCCQNKDMSFSCCPIVKAVCCSDHIHCCPNGWHCDVQQGTCRRNDDSNMVSPLLKKIPGNVIKNEPVTEPGYNYIKFN